MECGKPQNLAVIQTSAHRDLDAATRKMIGICKFSLDE